MSFGIEIINQGSIFDGHIHTRNSDGSLTAREHLRIIATYNQAIADGAIKAEPLQHIAFTDHHTAKTFDESKYLARGYGINLIPGIEISTRDFSSCHVLGYGMSDRELLNKTYKATSAMREKKLLHFIDVLELDYKIMLDPNWVQDMAETHTLSRKKIIHKAQPLCRNLSLKKIFENEVGPAEAEQAHAHKHTAAQAIKTIRAGGGVAVLAHPWSWKKRESGNTLRFREFEKHLEGLLDAGLQGIEIPQNQDKNSAGFYEQVIKDHGLLRVGGSDMHHPNERKLGNMAITHDNVDALLEQIDHNNREVNKKTRLHVVANKGIGFPRKPLIKETVDNAQTNI
ncbi:MAG: hypothetical protein LBG88_00150 [Christensenellaceae bacterium]|jgi:predicted metal-dependent phosphoesterase TrpH|nr:hypothetical protein [Christensenellaceae bacterium]